MQEQAEQDEEWHAQLLQAAKNGDDDALQSLSLIPDINLEDKDGHRAVDYAWERQHFMFVLSLLKRDSAFPLGFHLELESDKAEWKDLKRFVEERNRLHNFVKDGSYGQVKTNCSSIKSRYFLNSENQSLLYAAVKYKKFEISDFLESIGVEFFNNNEKSAVENLIWNNVNDNLNDFVNYFVKEFEAKLHAYYLILEGEIKKAGKFSDKFSEIIGQGVGAAAGGLIGCFVSTLTAGADGGKLGIAGAKLGAEGGKAITGYVGSAIGNDQHRKKAITLQDLINCAKKDKEDKDKFRRRLVEDGVDIFQSFEMQFMRVSTDQGPKQAMQLLARDATNRIINYYGGNKDVNNLIEGVVSGSSKIEPVWGVPIVTSKIKNPGFTINYGSYNQKWLSASLYEKVGLVRQNIYYEKKDRKSRVGKYGFRRLLKFEDWDTSKDSWNELDHSSDVKSRFKNYKYVLNSPDSTNIFENINLNDENLMEERIKEILKENKNDIIEAINFLKEQSQGYVEDRRILKNLENNLKSLKVDEYFEKFKQYFEEAKAEREEISKSIKDGQEDNKKDHKTTHEKLDTLHVLVAEKNKYTEGPVWFDVREPTDHFSGRKKELTDLHNKIHRNPENSTVISQMTSISGLGGIGKTELARQYIKEHGKDFDNVIWINSESEATLNESFRRLAYNKLKIETKDPHGKEKSMTDVVEDVYTFFSKSKTLFVFDNAEENDDFKNYLPLACFTPGSKTPYILITSRNREWKKGIEIIHLNELTLEDAVDLIGKELKIDEENQKQELEALAEKLQCFPLAIHQAIAYIADQQLTDVYSICNYLEEYEKKTQDLLESEAFTDYTNDYEKTTFKTWKITIDKIVSDKEHGELASDVLNALAYLAPDNIPREMFLVFARGEETKLKSAVRLLVKYSMVNGEQKQAVLNIHRLVQAVIRLHLKSQNKEEKILKDVFELLRQNFPYHGEKLDDSAKIRQYLPHLEAFTSHIDQWIKKKPQDKGNIEKDYLVQLIIWMNHGYNDLGNPQKQKDLLERALTIQEKHYGSDHFEVARTIVNLSNAYSELGDPQKQKDLIERALAILEKHYGSDHFVVAATLVNLGNAYGDLGDPQKKKDLLERALAIKEKHYGSDHFEVARTLVNLSNAYSKVGDPQKQKNLLERALAILEKHYGSDHFVVAATLVNLGNAYGDLGDPQKKKDLLERALAIDEKHYGSDHFEVAATLVNLGNAYGDLGDPQKQKDLLERALAIDEKHYGSDHFEVAATLVNLSNAYSKLGDPQKQKNLLERALAIKEKHYGSDHFEVAATLVNLGNAYGDLGDPQKQKNLLERALAILEKHYGSDHFVVAATLVNLGNAFGDLGDPQKEKDLLERALAIKEKHYGSDHFEVARTIVNLSNAYSELGDPQKQKDLIERALAIKEKHYGSDHFEVARTLVNLSNAYSKLGDPQKQKNLLERALAILEKHYGSDHFVVAATLVNLGNAYGVLGDPQKKKDLLERALAIKEKHYGSDHFVVAATLVNLGNAYGDLGDPQKQKDLLERALAIDEKHYGSDHFEVAATLVNLSNAYSKLGDPQKQKNLLERALAILEKHYGSDHFVVARTIVNLGNAYGDLGDPQKKKDLLERALAINEKHYGSDHFEVAATLVNLGNAYGDLGDPQKKKDLLERALAILEKHYGSDHFVVAATLVNLGNAYGNLGDPPKKKNLLERALAINEKHYGSDHFEVAKTIVNLGIAYGDLGDPQKKKNLLERALAILEKHYGSDHFVVGATLVNLGNAYGDLGDPQKKKDLLERALAILLIQAL